MSSSLYQLFFVISFSMYVGLCPRLCQRENCKFGCFNLLAVYHQLHIHCTITIYIIKFIKKTTHAKRFKKKTKEKKKKSTNDFNVYRMEINYSTRKKENISLNNSSTIWRKIYSFLLSFLLSNEMNNKGEYLFDYINFSIVFISLKFLCVEFQSIYRHWFLCYFKFIVFAPIFDSAIVRIKSKHLDVDSDKLPNIEKKIQKFELFAQNFHIESPNMSNSNKIERNLGESRSIWSNRDEKKMKMAHFLGVFFSQKMDYFNLRSQ